MDGWIDAWIDRHLYRHIDGGTNRCGILFKFSFSDQVPDWAPNGLRR